MCYFSRYGDSLNPWGDLIAMAKAWCLLKPGKRVAISVPVSPVDAIYFNSHKLYGPIMLPHLFANWKQIYSELDYNQFYEYYNYNKCAYCYEELFIVEK